MIDNSDTVNAKFLYMRASNAVKQSRDFQSAWQAARELHHRNYGTVLGLMDADKFEDSQNEMLRQVLVEHLRTWIVPDYLRKCYSTIELAKVKQCLAAEKLSKQDFCKLIASSGLLS